jgi:hypothetical protein
MKSKHILLSPLILIPLLPSLINGRTGLLFPSLWLTALMMTPLFTAPLIAGERSRGTDLLLLTRPLSDGKLIRQLFLQAAKPFLLLFTLPLITASLFRFITGDDPGAVLLTCLVLPGGILIFTGLGLVISALASRTVTAWILSYLVLLPLTFSPPLFPRWTDPLFSGYIPLSAVLAFPLLVFWSLAAARLVLARFREDRSRKGQGKGFLLLSAALVLGSLLPGGADLTFSGQFRMNRVTAEALRAMDDPVHVRWYRTANYRSYGGGMENLEALLLSMRLKGGFSLRYTLNRGDGGVLLQDEEIVLMGREKGWTAQTVKKNGSYQPLYSVWEIEYHGRRETLPFVYNPLVAEEQFLAALQRLSRGSRPVAGIITGRSDRPVDEFWSVLKGSLGEYYRTVDYTGRVDDIPAEQPDCLFVLGSRDLSDWESARIFAYVEGGGAALVTLSTYELDPVKTDRIARAEENGMTRELAEREIFPGESLILDPERALYLTAGAGETPVLYPLWFSTGSKGFFDYQALWSVPLYYTGKESLLWETDSSPRSYPAGSLSDLNPASLAPQAPVSRLSYTTALALKLGDGRLAVISGEESLSNLMALADNRLGNSAWIQSLAFFLSRNEELLTLRRKSGRRIY